MQTRKDQGTLRERSETRNAERKNRSKEQDEVRGGLTKAMPKALIEKPTRKVIDMQKRTESSGSTSKSQPWQRIQHYAIRQKKDLPGLLQLMS